MEVWVIRTRMSICLAKDERAKEIPSPMNLSAIVFSNGSRQFERKSAPENEYNGDDD